MIAVLGASGQLGSAFVRSLGDSCHPVTREDLDLADSDAILSWVESVEPEVVINCAAYTAVDAAESDAETARKVNALAVGTLAGAAARHGTALVTFSTDYVFDGEKGTGYVESDRPNPLNVYGRTKLEGERLALAAHRDVLVVRTSWLLSSTHRNFMTTMLALLAEGEVSVVTDQRGRPTLVDDLVTGTLMAVDAGASGILHLTNQGETTWFQLAREIAELAGFDPDLVKPTTSAVLDRPALRPKNSVLDSERLSELGIAELAQRENTLSRAIRDHQSQFHR